MRLVTTLIGIAVTDVWHLMNHEMMLPLRVRQKFGCEEDRVIPFRSFAGVVSGQLLKMADVLEAKAELEAREKRKREVAALYAAAMSAVDVAAAVRPVPPIVVPVGHDGDANADAEYFTFDDGGFKPIGLCIPVRDYIDVNGDTHTMAKFPVVESRDKKRRRTMVKNCDMCGKAATVFCHQCQKPFCCSLCPNSTGHGRKCFHNHLPNRSSTRNSSSSSSSNRLP